MCTPSFAFVPCAAKPFLLQPSHAHRILQTQSRQLRVRIGPLIVCQNSSNNIPSLKNTNKSTTFPSLKDVKPQAMFSFLLETPLLPMMQTSRSLFYSLSAFLTIYITKHSAFAATTPTSPSPTPAEVPLDPSLATPSLPKPLLPSINDTLNQASQDDSTFSKILVYLVFFLLIYVTIGTIILTIDNFLKNRNRENSKKWLQARIDGEPYPSNWYFDNMKDTSLPKDFPREELYPADENEVPIIPKSKPKPKRKSKPSDNKSQEVSGNRQMRREMKKSGDKDQSDRKADKKLSLKEASALRARRKAEADAKKKGKR